jgi:hypothetical protein
VRYVLLDTSDDWRAIEVAGHRGALVAEFNTVESAIALVLQRLALGDRGVIAVDSIAGVVVFPTAEAPGTQRGTSASGTRRRVRAEDAAALVGAASQRKRGR